MAPQHDGPATARFTPVALAGNVTFGQLDSPKFSKRIREQCGHAQHGPCTAWGIPFDIDRIVVADKAPVSVRLGDVKAPWIVFLHTSDFDRPARNEDGLVPHSTGDGRLAEPIAAYVMRYADGQDLRLVLRGRREIGAVIRGWGENCFEAVGMRKPFPIRSLTDQAQVPGAPWGFTQTRAAMPDILPWMNWLWAWENPRPDVSLSELSVEPLLGTVILAALSAGEVSQHPLRWETRRKAILRLPRGVSFDPALDERGLLAHIQLDLGQVISAVPRFVYPNDAWAKGYNNQMPEISKSEILVEYAAHPDACFHFSKGESLPVANVETLKKGPLTPVAPATQRVRLRVVDRDSGRPVAVKLHAHGQAGEYLAPVDRNRLPNPAWFEDYSCDFLNQSRHWCTYIPGETTIDLPLGSVYIEVSKGFEIRPVRKVVKIGRATREIVVELEKVLPWRERGWVTADTHVHFLSPHTARLEGAAEGVNVVNLLASQWGELMTNAGDFDGQSTFGVREAGGDGEWLVRVGTENRQHVLGHISLLGYNGNIIAPMTTGGPDESAIGDPVGCLLMDWARQCRAQGGIVVLPHFPNPRAEHAASIVEGLVDAVEMTAWGNLYGGIDPYSLSDWYRYLNCGYFVPAVAGTDKMEARTAVGTVRTYAKIQDGQPFTYDTWKDAVRAGNTFVTYGPLVEFSVEGRPAGTHLRVGSSGGTVDVAWEIASVTVPMSRLEVVVNGEIRECRAVRARQDSGACALKIDRSAWIALLIRGHYPDKPEIVAAHSSPVMVHVEHSAFGAAADAHTILDQIEGALAFIDTIGTRTETAVYKRMRTDLTAAHRKLHNRMHEMGFDHDHTSPEGHRTHRTRKH